MAEFPKIIKIKIVGDDKTHTVKHLVYEDIVCSESDTTLQDLVREARKEFFGEIENVRITIQMDF